MRRPNFRFKSGGRESMWEVRGPSFLSVQDLPVALRKGTIIDLETTGLEPAKSAIVCLGCVFGSTLEIHMRGRSARPDEFYNQLRSVLRSRPQPFYAYNSKFDGSLMKRYLGYK